jgi:hypothetical protein
LDLFAARRLSIQKSSITFAVLSGNGNTLNKQKQQFKK